MKTKLLFTITFLFFTAFIFAQNTISEKVVDEKGKPVPGANIYIDGTYDGATSSETGDFSFETSAIGNQFLVVSFLIYDTFRKEIDVTNFKDQTVKLRENVNSLDAVVITAGTLESGDKARVSVLKPLDIVTTAGSAGNIIAAFYTEGDILFSKNFAAKVGFRLSNNSLLDETAIAPRASLAYKISKSSQFSFAYGDFTQTPVVDYIKYSKYHQFESEKARHYILNYQFTKPGQTFRAEAYFKDYSNLVQYDTRDIQYNSNFNNNGSGYAKGLDIFW
jgi:hypothetical protein